MTVHELKVVPPYFDAIVDGSKPFEVRRNDRGFQRGDLLRLREWHPFDSAVGGGSLCGIDGCRGYRHTAHYATDGRVLTVEVTYVYAGDDRLGGLPSGYVVLGLDVHMLAGLNPRSSSSGYPRRNVSWSSASAASGDNLVSERAAAAIADFAQADGEARGDLLIVELGSNDLTSKDGEHWTQAETPLAEQVAARAQRIAEAAHPDSSVAVGEPFVGPLDAGDWRCPSCGNDPADPTLHADGCPTIGTPAQHEPPADGSETYLDPDDIPSPLLLDQPTPDGA